MGVGVGAKGAGYLLEPRVEPCFLALPRMWKPRGAPRAALDPELVHFAPFGRLPAGASYGAGFGALPNRAIKVHVHVLAQVAS